MDINELQNQQNDTNNITDQKDNVCLNTVNKYKPTVNNIQSGNNNSKITLNLNLLNDKSDQISPSGLTRTRSFEESMVNNSTITMDHKKSTSSSTENEKVLKKKVHIRNIEWNVHENLLRKFLSKFGETKKCTILRDDLTNKPKGFGHVEFYNEEDAEKCVNAQSDDLVLNGRDLVVNYYIEKNKNKISKRKHMRERIRRDTEARSSESDRNNQSDFESTNLNSNNIFHEDMTIHIASLVEKLPYNVLANIFSNLSIRDLCIAEQVCKYWYTVSRMVWKSKKILILNDKKVYDSYSHKSTNFGFECRPDFNFKAFRQIMNKNIGTNLMHLDLSEYSSKLDHRVNDCIKSIGENCPNLTFVNLSRLNFSNFSITKMVKYCKKLKEINLAYCSRVSDSTVGRIFRYCKDLEIINLTFCHTLYGKCFESVNENLKSICLDQCENISDEYFLVLFNRSKQLTSFSLKRTTQCASHILVYMIHNLLKLETLYLSGSGFDSLSSFSLENVKFDQLKNLTKLDLSFSNGDNKVLSCILKSCKNLKYLDLNNCSKLTDEMFTLTDSIKAPLEDLNLSMIKQLTDVSLEILISQISYSLKVLKIKGCDKLTDEAISNTLSKLSNLNYLDIRLNSHVTNLVLETALSIDYRHIYILCYDTSVDTNKFLYDHENTTKDYISRGCFVFKYKNLKFEAFKPMNIKSVHDEMDIWQDNGFYYIGSPLGSDEDDEECLSNKYEPYAFNNNFIDNDFEDDLEDFLNNDETEMLNEMDEF